MDNSNRLELIGGNPAADGAAEAVYQQALSDIRTGYDALEYTLGWRFLYTPRASFSLRPRMLLVLLNPYGVEEKRGCAEYEPSASVEKGNAFRTEFWESDGTQSDLQKRVQLLFQKLASRLNVDRDSLMDSTPTLNFCPFRTRDNKFREKDTTLRGQGNQAVRFSVGMWTRILSQVQPRAIVFLSVDQGFRREFNSVFPQIGYREDGAETEIKAGTKRCVVHTYRRQADNALLPVVYMPHPSRGTQNIIEASDPDSIKVFNETMTLLAKYL